LESHRQSTHLFLQCETIAEPTILKPEDAYDGAVEMVERLQPVKPGEKVSTDVDVPGEATKVVLTVGATSAGDAKVVEAADLVVTDDPGGATPATETPLAEAVKHVENVPIIVAAKPPDAHRSGKCTICIYHPFFDVDTYRF
jgi:hypothetical protein